MRRRQLSRFLGAVAAAGPFPVLGQSANAPTVGVLSPFTEEGARTRLEALRKGLIQNGLVEGSTVRLLVRHADNNFERLPDLARDLRVQGSRMIVTSGTTSVNAAQRAAPDLPIVMAG